MSAVILIRLVSQAHYSSHYSRIVILFKPLLGGYHHGALLSGRLAFVITGDNATADPALLPPGGGSPGGQGSWRPDLALSPGRHNTSREPTRRYHQIQRYRWPARRHITDLAITPADPALSPEFQIQRYRCFAGRGADRIWRHHPQSTHLSLRVWRYHLVVALRVYCGVIAQCINLWK